MLVKFTHAETGEEIWVNPYQVRTVRGDKQITYIAMSLTTLDSAGFGIAESAGVIPVKQDVEKVVKVLNDYMG
jgi:hypothetical protein